MESFELLINEDTFLEESDICKLLESHNKEEVLKSLNNIAFVFAKAFYEDVLKDQYNNFINLIKIYLDSNNESFKYNDLIEYLLKEVNVDEPLLEIRNSVVGYPDKYNLAVLGVLKALNYTNDVDIQEVTGLFYYLRDGCIDIKKSIEYSTLAADKGDPEAQTRLGFIYIDNKEADYYNLELSIKYSTMSCENEYYDCAFILGNIYSWFDEYINIPLAIKYLKLAIEYDDEDMYSILRLAEIYQECEEYKDIDKAIEMFTYMVNYNNDPDALYDLGYIYENEDGYINMEKAIEYYSLSADQNFSFAQYNLGVIYLIDDKYKDIDKAIKYLTLASNQGLKEAQHNLAYIYENEKGYINIDLAIKYYTLASEQGLNYSLRNLGELYYQNNDYKDIKKSLFLLNKAGKSGQDYAVYEYLKLLLEYYSDSLDNVVISETKDFIKDESSYAHLFLGQRYLEGKLVPLSVEKAFDEFNEAIKLNDKNDEAYYELGTYYYYGKGVERDIVKAKEYLEIANKLGQSCEFILQLIDDELGVSNEENYIAGYLDKQKGYYTALDIINELFENVKLDKDIKTYLVTSLVTYFEYVSIEKQANIKFDYSTCINMLFKAMECVIRKYYIDGYRKYLKDNIDPNEMRKNKYFTYVNEYGEYDYLDKGKFDKFTLGDFKMLINLRNGINLKPGPKKIKYSPSTNKIIDNTLIKYSIEELFDINQFSANSMRSEIQNYYISISNFIDQFVDEVRNPATHTTVINRDKAESMINYFLFSKKILTNFYRKLK